MAITIEDGTGLTAADAYLAVADVDTYFAKRGDETWADQDTATKEAAIVRATFALDSKYRENWKGVRKTAAQALAWPRIAKKDSTELIEDDEGYDVASDSVPQAVKDATAEVALIELTTRFVTQEVTRDDMVKKEVIGPLSTEYFDGAPSGILFPHIDGILDVVTTGSAASGTTTEVYLTPEEVNQGNDPYETWINSSYMNLVKFP